MSRGLGGHATYEGAGILSVITPAFKAGDFLAENLASVACLSIPHEHIVIDGDQETARWSCCVHRMIAICAGCPSPTGGRLTRSTKAYRWRGASSWRG